MNISSPTAFGGIYILSKDTIESIARNESDLFGDRSIHQETPRGSNVSRFLINKTKDNKFKLTEDRTDIDLVFRQPLEDGREVYFTDTNRRDLTAFKGYCGGFCLESIKDFILRLYENTEAEEFKAIMRRSALKFIEDNKRWAKTY